MLQARVLLCLSIAAVQWAQVDAAPDEISPTFQCYQQNPWWTFMNDTTGDSCYIALHMRAQVAGLASTPAGSNTSTLMHPEDTDLCLPVVYDMYGACLACMQGREPINSPIVNYTEWCSQNSTADPATTRNIESLAPPWTGKVDFRPGVWNMSEVKAAAQPSTSETAPPSPNPTVTSSLGEGQGGEIPDSTSSHKSSNVGPIVGGVIGGLALISIGVAILFFYLRRQRNRRVAPSSEFTRYIQPGGTQMSTRSETAVSGSRGAIPRQDSATIPLTAGEDEVLEAPPAFTPGQYTGPIFEKDGYRADPNAPLFSSGNSASQPSQSQNNSQGPSGSAL